jgi:addiction module HigA family antidote
MVEYAAKRNANRCPTHPGELLRVEVIPATGKTKTEIATLLGISRQHLYDILEERKPVSPAVAVRLGKLFGDGAGAWVRMQSAYDIWHAERELANAIKKIPFSLPGLNSSTRTTVVPVSDFVSVSGQSHQSSQSGARGGSKVLVQILPRRFWCD